MLVLVFRFAALGFHRRVNDGPVGQSVGATQQFALDRARLSAMGIPMDIRMSGLERRTTAGPFPTNVGWEQDIEDDDTNAEVDKKMRNNGFMKGAEIYCDGMQGIPVMALADPLLIRSIILRETMYPDFTYYLRFKTVLDDPSREFYVDYLEYCPKEVYHNPETPEDIW